MRFVANMFPLIFQNNKFNRQNRIPQNSKAEFFAISESEKVIVAWNHYIDCTKSNHYKI